MFKSIIQKALSILLLLFLQVTVFSQVPQITGISPISGPVGTIVTITGNNFSTDPAKNIVRFGTVRASIITASTGTLTVSVPAGASHELVSVTTGKLTVYAPGAFMVSFKGGYAFYDNSFRNITAPLSTAKDVNGMITTDLDEDGRPDIVTTGGTSAAPLHISVFRNTSNNQQTSFEKQDFSLNTSNGIAKELVAADLDGDGRQDLAIISEGATSLVLLPNTSIAGNINFGQPVEISLESAVSWIAAGDFNNDGKPDIAVANQLSSVFIYLNNSSGNTLSFVKGPEITTGAVPVGIRVADIDQDGWQDIITASAAAQSLCSHRNTSVSNNISFAEIKFHTIGERPSALAMGDFEGNGKLDFAVNAAAVNKVFAVLNSSTPGHIQLISGVGVPTADNPKAIVISDMNGDAQADIITSCTGFLKVAVIRNNTHSAGYFAFDRYLDYQVNASNPVLLVIADYNGDGQPDMAVGHPGFSKISLLRNATTEPTVRSFSPAVATTDETVTITGNNFFDITAVRFGGVAAASFTVESATTIKAVLAAGATGSVEVQNAHGTSSLAGFIFGGAPVINSFTPSSTGFERPVVITGKNFSNVSAVKFGGTDAASFTVNSTTSITARPAAGASGSITVVNNYGTISKEGFTYLNTPIITYMSPPKASAGTTVTLEGKYFAANAAENIVQFGTQKATVTEASSTTIKVTVPNGADYAPVTVTSNQHTIYSKQHFIPVFSGGDLPFDDKFFLPPTELPSINEPWSTASADIDGDGKPDFLVGCSNQSAVYLNKSTEAAILFEKAWEITLARNDRGTNAIAAGDFNADGKPDLLVNAATLKVLINTSTNGNISFAPPVDLLNYSCEQLDVTDLDGDGRPDVIASTGFTNGGIKIFRNTGNPSTLLFEPVAVDLKYGGRFVLTDLDFDGKPDFAACSEVSKNIGIIRNNSIPGRISFEPSHELLLQGYPSYISAADLNEDGRKDLAVSFRDHSAYCIIQNGSGTGALVFNYQSNYTADQPVRSIHLSDLNGDGRADMIISYKESTVISVVKNTTAPNAGDILKPVFGTKVDYPAGDTPGEVLVADWNGDNFFDLAVMNKWNKIVFLRNNLFRPIITSFSPTQVSPGTKVTIKGYNFKDVSAVHFGNNASAAFQVISPTEILAEVGEGNEGKLSVTNPWLTYEKGTITFPKPVITGFSPAAGPAGSTITITGANFSLVPASNYVYFGNVKGEVISASATGLQVKVPVSAAYQLLSVTTFGVTAWATKPFNITYPSIGTIFMPSTFGDQSTHAPGNVRGVASGDLNNDGLPDLAVADMESNSLSVLINTSTAGQVGFAAPVRYGNLVSPNRVFIGDINGDGLLDIVVISESYKQLYVFRNKTSSTVSFEQHPAIALCGNVKTITAGDLDGDGKLDMVLSNGGDSRACVLRNTSRGDEISFATTTMDIYTQKIKDVQIADLDGDNKPELIVTRELTSGIDIYRNLNVPGSIAFDNPYTIPLAGTGAELVSADFDGDGKPDVAVTELMYWRPHRVSFFRNTSTTGQISMIAAGNITVDYLQPWTIRTSDMDGDGKPDIIIGRGSIGFTRVFAFRNTSAGANISFDAGVEYRALYDCTDLSIADLDGDSRQDIITAYPGGSGEPGSVIVLRNKAGEPMIVPNGVNPVSGQIFTRLIIDPSVQSLNGQPYVQRHVDITPVSNPQSATALITLLFTQQEFDNFNNTAGHGPDLPRNANDAAGISNLRVFQYHGSSNSGLPGTYSGTGIEIDPDDAAIVWNATQKYWEVKFSVSGFSGFFVSSKGFQFNQTPAPKISADFAFFCNNGKVILHSSAEQNNQWYRDGNLITGATATTYQAAVAGNYSVTATNNNIVSPASAAFKVTEGGATTKPAITRNGLTLQSSSATGNQWYRDGELLVGATTHEIIPINNSRYTVQVNMNGCVSAMSDSYHFLITGVIDIDGQQFIRLTPNPVRTEAQLYFRLNNLTMLDISITDMNGRTVITQHKRTSGNRINMAMLPKGMYAVRITSGDRKISYTLKIMKH